MISPNDLSCCIQHMRRKDKTLYHVDKLKQLVSRSESLRSRIEALGETPEKCNLRDLSRSEIFSHLSFMKERNNSNNPPTSERIRRAFRESS